MLMSPSSSMTGKFAIVLSIIGQIAPGLSFPSPGVHGKWTSCMGLGKLIISGIRFTLVLIRIYILFFVFRIRKYGHFVLRLRALGSFTF